MLNSFKFKTLDGSSKVEFKKKINKNSFRKNQMLANIMSDTKKKAQLFCFKADVISLLKVAYSS